MATLSSPQPCPRPRPLSSCSTDSTGPYLSAHSGSALVGGTVARKRTSQTFRSSPLAGPALSYASLSAFDTSSSSHESSLSSMSESSSLTSTDPGLEFRSGKGSLRTTQRCLSTGAIAAARNDSLRPPLPAWSRNSRGSIISIDSTRSKRLSRTTSTSSSQGIPTLSSLISLSITEAPHPHVSYPAESHQPQRHETHSLRFPGQDAPPHLYAYTSDSTHPPLSSSASSVPSRRHSRLSFSPSPLFSPTPSACSSSSSTSVHSVTSVSSISSSTCGSIRSSIREEDVTTVKQGDSEAIATIRIRIEDCDASGGKGEGASKMEKQRRRMSLPAPVQKHDWLAAPPTPVFTRSALRTQSVVMPVSARERGRTEARHDLQVPSNSNRKQVAAAEDKVETDKRKQEKTKDKKGPVEKEKGQKEETRSLKTGTSLHRRLTKHSLLSRIPSLVPVASSKRNRGKEEPATASTSTTIAKAENVDAEFGVLGNERWSSSATSPSSSAGGPTSLSSVSSTSTCGHLSPPPPLPHTSISASEGPKSTGSRDASPSPSPSSKRSARTEKKRNILVPSCSLTNIWRRVSSSREYSERPKRKGLFVSR